ncbi:MAG: short-chain dehydrogenase [Labilithrix sp.]|nr:short-chain dehydrogenase [Labilithrix sp.]
MRGVLDGQTVLLTGASSGIGLAMARLLGPRVATLVLVARRTERLETLRAELVARTPGLRAVVLGCDLGVRADVESLVAEVEARGLAVDVLVNNAGVGMMGLADAADPAKAAAMIDLNVTSLTLLTLAFLPGMVARRRGGILNVSSGFGLATMPMFATYAATKHYVTGFTESLRHDLAGTGVVATQICPGPVRTEFEQVMGNPTGKAVPAFVEITAEHCARVALAGFERGRAMVVPGAVMKIVMLINALSPRVARRIFGDLAGRLARKSLAGRVL